MLEYFYENGLFAGFGTYSTAPCVQIDFALHSFSLLCSSILYFSMESRTPLGPLIPSHQNGVSEAVDFAKLTASQFGITPDSFTAFPKDKGEENKGYANLSF